MSDEPVITIKNINYHRNGVCGMGFYVVLFDWNDGGTLRHMVATYRPNRDKKGYLTKRCAQSDLDICVLDADMTAAGNVAFGTNSWRGDHFADQIQTALYLREQPEIAGYRAKVSA